MNDTNNTNQPVNFHNTVEPTKSNETSSTSETKTNTNWSDKIAEARLKAEKSAANLNKEKPQAVKEKEPTKSEVKEEKPSDTFASYWDLDAINRSAANVPNYTPSQEELDKAKKIENNKEADASSVITCHIGNDSEFTKAFEYIKDFINKYKNLSNEDIENHPEIKEVLTWLGNLNATVDSSLGTNQQALLVAMIDALHKQGKTLTKLTKELSLAKMQAAIKNNGSPELFRGDIAMKIINNRYRGIYRINLHNSGFWIKSMPLRNVDIDAWMQEIDFEKKQLGRIIGGHFYIGANIFLKQKLAELVKMTVIDSNLEHWNEGSTLIDSISIHDYDTLCWAYSTMMYRDGIYISTICTNPECKHHNSSSYLDLAKLSYINPDVYSAEAIQWMISGISGKIRTQKDIKYYKEKLLKNVAVIKFTDTDMYELKDPSLGEFISIGTSALGKLAASVKDGNVTEEVIAQRRNSIFHLTKMLSPWISRIILNDDSGNVIGVIDDKDAILKSLETALESKYNVIYEIQKFITNTKASFYTATSMKCSKCGKQPNLLTENLYPLDVEYILFCLSYLKLEQIGNRL